MWTLYFFLLIFSSLAATVLTPMSFLYSVFVSISLPAFRPWQPEMSSLVHCLNYVSIHPCLLHRPILAQLTWTTIHLHFDQSDCYKSVSVPWYSRSSSLGRFFLLILMFLLSPSCQPGKGSLSYKNAMLASNHWFSSLNQLHIKQNLPHILACLFTHSSAAFMNIS